MKKLIKKIKRILTEGYTITLEEQILGNMLAEII